MMCAPETMSRQLDQPILRICKTAQARQTLFGLRRDYGGYQEPTYCSPYPAWQDSDPETSGHDILSLQEGLGAAPLYWMGGPEWIPRNRLHRPWQRVGLGQAKDILAVMKSRSSARRSIIWMDIETQQGWDYFYPKGSEDCNSERKPLQISRKTPGYSMGSLTTL